MDFDNGKFSINAAWEIRDRSNLICRWFVAWQSVSENNIAGIVAGYTGGGSYTAESFFGTLEADQLTSLWIDYTDVIKREEIDFAELGPNVQTACSDANKLLWRWNDNDQWSDSDRIVLKKGNRKHLEMFDEKDMLYLEMGDGWNAPFIGAICELAGLTAAPQI